MELIVKPFKPTLFVDFTVLAQEFDRWKKTNVFVKKSIKFKSVGIDVEEEDEIPSYYLNFLESDFWKQRELNKESIAGKINDPININVKNIHSITTSLITLLNHYFAEITISEFIDIIDFFDVMLCSREKLMPKINFELSLELFSALIQNPHFDPGVFFNKKKERFEAKPLDWIAKSGNYFHNYVFNKLLINIGELRGDIPREFLEKNELVHFLATIIRDRRFQPMDEESLFIQTTKFFIENPNPVRTRDLQLLVNSFYYIQIGEKVIRDVFRKLMNLYPKLGFPAKKSLNARESWMKIYQPKTFHDKREALPIGFIPNEEGDSIFRESYSRIKTIKISADEDGPGRFNLRQTFQVIGNDSHFDGELVKIYRLIVDFSQSKGTLEVRCLDFKTGEEIKQNEICVTFSVINAATNQVIYPYKYWNKNFSFGINKIMSYKRAKFFEFDKNKIKYYDGDNETSITLIIHRIFSR